jgi:cardiolipin synthase
VGSTNLNLTSWIGNWELDVAVEDERFAQEMEKMYLDDLQHATEILLSPKKRIRPAVKRPPRWIGARGSEGSAGRMAAGALGVGNAVGAAITNRRLLGPAEARSLASVGLALVGLATVGVLWPRWISVPIAVMCVWVAVALLIRAFSLHREANRHAKELESQRVVARPQQPGTRGT